MSSASGRCESVMAAPLVAGSRDSRGKPAKAATGAAITAWRAQISISSKSSLRAPHSGQTQFGGTSSQRVPGAIPSSGRPASSS
ncbi:Uncharacterised protein [Bordetella pertussis]|nr:Uncharacterised protein [Bordetella pertussis]